MMRWRCFLLLTMCAALVIPAEARDYDYRCYELSFSLGGTFPRERDPLNVPGEASMPNAVVFGIGFRKYLGDRGAIGLRSFLTTNSLGQYPVRLETSSVSELVDYRIATYTMGLEGLAFLSDAKHVRPYLLLLLEYSGGALSSDKGGTLRFGGFQAGGGAGIRIGVSTTMALSFEGVFMAGNARWAQQPFLNSAGTKYNPGTAMVLANLWVLIAS